MFEWEDDLKKILMDKIEEGINEYDLKHPAVVPWLGDRAFEIMADAVISVLCGMEDSQQFLRGERLLKD